MENTEDTFIKNGFMFIYARENKPTAEKILNIKKILDADAYINSRDANDKKNTILHIATQREEKDLVEFLLREGALLVKNLDGKTPLQIAKEKNTELSKEIVNILTKNGKHLPHIDVSSSSSQQREQIQNPSISQNNWPTSPTGIQFKKRNGTSGVRGQFYETKLLSLVLHRALHDKEIEDCYLAANIDEIGDFDDVCFRFKMQEDGVTKHIICFTQAKHREDANKHRLTVQSLEGKVKPCWEPMSLDVMRGIDAADGEQLLELINSSEMDNLALVLTSLYENTEMGQKYHEKIKKEFCRPIGQLTNKLVEVSGNNENLMALVEELPYHLPEIVDLIFKKINGERDDQGNSSRDPDSLESFPRMLE
ncbi:hypothetical protein PYW07_006570 [Mythimna separata]|uniref:Uncharacterized protein n=1 Tax=Mythimna separata TaxID=271217 RepID=A0AAD7YWA7_MYTSE|nr:hypothetical protein PYW07_006570 [Mythimna separata]